MSDHLTLGVQCIVTAAKSFNVDVEDGPGEWVGEHFNSEILTSTTTASLRKRDERLLPTDVRAFRLDHIPVLIGELGGGSDRVQAQDSLRRFRNQIGGRYSPSEQAWRCVCLVGTSLGRRLASS